MQVSYFGLQRNVDGEMSSDFSEKVRVEDCV